MTFTLIFSFRQYSKFTHFCIVVKNVLSGSISLLLMEFLILLDFESHPNILLGTGHTLWNHHERPFTKYGDRILRIFWASLVHALVSLMPLILLGNFSKKKKLNRKYFFNFLCKTQKVLFNILCAYKGLGYY